MNHNSAYLIVAAIYVYMAIYTLSKDLYDQKNRLFFIISLLFAYWALVNSSMFLITDPIIAAATRKNMVFTWGIIYSCIFHLTFILSGYFSTLKSRKVRWLFYLSIYLPATMNIILYYFQPYPAQALLLTNNGWIIKDFFIDSFLWNYYFYIYYLIFMCCTMIVLFRWRKTARRKAEIKQSSLMLATYLFALIAGSLLEIVLPLMGFTFFYGITIYIALVPIFGMWYGIKHYSLMNFDPTRLTSEMMALMSDGMIVLDEFGKVAMMNSGAGQILGYNIESSLSISQLCDHEISDDLSSETMTFKDQGGKGVEVLVSTLPIMDEVDEAYGIVMLFQDIRKIKRYQNKLEDLNETLEKKVSQRTQALNLTNSDLMAEVSMRKNAEKESRQLANYDYLTKLPNQRLFKEKLTGRINTSYNKSKGFALLFIDIDDFKRINDTMGHSVGDDLIIAIANRLKTYVEKEVNLTRIGGDEFIIIIEDGLDYDVQVKQILALFSSSFEVGRYQLNVNCSIGGACFPDDGGDYESLIKAADIAMYEAKDQQSIHYKFYDHIMVQGLEEEVALTNDLFKAVEGKQFFVNYQPIVSALTGEIVSAEALVRWRHPSGGLISPGIFIPLSEKIGMMDQITEVVLEDTRELLKAIDFNENKNFKVAVNISANQLHKEGLLQALLNSPEEINQMKDHIEFEVTEHTFIHNTPTAISILQEIRYAGMGVAIDDFGVNYASLNYLKKLPVSKLKIDKVFIDGIGQDHQDEGIIAAIITLAKRLSLQLVGEGVEHEHQAVFLRDNGCENIQGYYYHKPMSRQALLTLLEGSAEQ